MTYKTEKMKEKLNKSDSKIKDFEIEKSKKISKILKEIKDEYDVKIKKINEEKKQINNAIYLNYKDSLDAIEYLVNKIEKEDYKLETTKIKYKTLYSRLIKDKYEIKDYFIVGLKKVKQESEIKKDNIYTKEDLSISFDNFITLALISNEIESNSNIKCFKEKFKINYLNDDYHCNRNYLSYSIESFISNERFSYIKDYIITVIDYKLDKEDYSISFDEMKTLADNFANNYNDSKKLVKDIK